VPAEVQRRLANVAQAITAPGDVVLVPDPSYPIHAFGFLMAGGGSFARCRRPTPEFFTILERAITHSIPKPIAVWCATVEPDRARRQSRFLKSWLPFAKKQGSSSCPTWPMPRSISDNNPPPRCCRSGAMASASSHLDVGRPIVPGGAWACGRQRAHHLGAEPG